MMRMMLSLVLGIATATVVAATARGEPCGAGLLSVVSEAGCATGCPEQDKRPPVGWMSWYALKFATDETSILKNARRFKESFGPYCDGRPIIWVDWEWYHEKFSWKASEASGASALAPNVRTFPRGLKPLSDDLKALGFVPGLWISLVTDVSTNAVYAAHSEWMAPVGALRWIGEVCADPFAPGFVSKAVPLFMQTYLNWGYDAFKLDGVYVLQEIDEQAFGPRYGKKRRDYPGMVKNLALSVRRTIGQNRYFLDCGCGALMPDMEGALDAFDASRVGSDVFTWSEFVSNAVCPTLKAYPRHARGLWLDLDTLVLRPEFSTLEQARSRVSFYALTGVPLTLGDPIDALDAKRIDLLRRAMPVAPMRSADGASASLRGDSLLIDAAFERTFSRWHVAGVFNFGSNRVERTVDFAKDMRLDGAVAVWDYWNDRFLGVVTNRLSVSLGPFETSVLRVTPVTSDGRATLLSVSRHLTQGGVELAAVESGVGVFRGRVRVVGGEPCVLTVLLPPQGGSVIASHPCTTDGDVCRLSIVSPQTGEVPFSLKFGTMR